MEGMENSEYLECSTPELWDVIRLKDKYNRNNIVEKNIGKEMDYYEIVKKLYLNNWWKSGVRIEKYLIYFDADTKTSTHEALELVKHFIIKQEKTFIGFDDWQCFKYALSPSFAQFIHKLGNFSFKNIGNTEVTIFFEITNNNF